MILFILQAVYLLSKHKNMVFCIQDIGEMTIDNGNSVRKFNVQVLNFSYLFF